MIKSKIIKTDAEWKSQLSEEAYVVCRQKGTEAPFSGKYYKYRENGIYSCICCDNELFSSDHKYDSGSRFRTSLLQNFYEYVRRRYNMRIS